MQHLTDEERGSLIDLLCDAHHFPEYAELDTSELHKLSTRQLVQMLNREPVTPEPTGQPSPPPLSFAEAVALYPDFEPKSKRKRSSVPRPYKAQLKHEGRNVYLGSFYTPVEAHAAIEQAKFRRSMGLPIK